jgi:hypothetical protein
MRQYEPGHREASVPVRQRDRRVRIDPAEHLLPRTTAQVGQGEQATGHGVAAAEQHAGERVGTAGSSGHGVEDARSREGKTSLTLICG